MSLDRFVVWPHPSNLPPRVEMIDALKRYIGNGGEVTMAHDEPERCFVKLPGRPSDPFKPLEILPDDRWFEVYLGSNCIDVITRQADEFTSVVADGFAALVARRWNGTRE